VPAYQGEHNEEILSERNVDAEAIADMKRRRVLLSRRSPVAPFD
jgi:CoA:oxalate CoA-transferase